MDLVFLISIGVLFVFGISLVLLLRYISSNQSKTKHKEVRMRLEVLNPTEISSVQTVNRTNGVSRTRVLVSGKSDVMYTEDLIAILPIENFPGLFSEYHSPVLLSNRPEYWRGVTGIQKIFSPKKVSGTIPHSGVLFQYLRSKGFGGEMFVELKNLDAKDREFLLSFFEDKQPS